MAFILLFVFFTAVLIGIQLFFPAIKEVSPSKTYGQPDETRLISLRAPAIGIYVLGGILALIFFSAHIIPNGHVALVKTFGQITSQRGTGAGGLTFTAPWQTVEAANVQTQSACPDGSTPKNNACPTAYAAFSHETIDASVVAIVNFKVSPDLIQQLYRTVGPDYESKIVLPRVAQAVKEETVKYNAVELAPAREEIRKNVTAKLIEDLKARSITVEDLIVVNVDFPNADVKKSIDAKVIQAQNAAAAEAQVQVSKAQAAQVVAAAQGAADARRIAAQAEADSNTSINNSLTGNVLQLRLAQTLGDKVQFLPSGQGLIIDPATLLKPK